MNSFSIGEVSYGIQVLHEGEMSQHGEVAGQIRVFTGYQWRDDYAKGVWRYYHAEATQGMLRLNLEGWPTRIVNRTIHPGDLEYNVMSLVAKTITGDYEHVNICG